VRVLERGRWGWGMNRGALSAGAGQPGQLWLVRHARPVRPDGSPVCGCCYGRLDWPADPLANQRLAQHLADWLPRAATVRSSSRQRTRALAQALLALRPDLQCAGSDARLDELDFGGWEGQRWDAIGEPAVSAWVRDFSDHAPGGGETVRQLLARVGAAWRAWQAAAEYNTVWLGHAGTLQAVQWLTQRAPLSTGANCPITSSPSSTSSQICPEPQAQSWPRSSVSFGGWRVFPRTYPR